MWPVSIYKKEIWIQIPAFTERRKCEETQKEEACKRTFRRNSWKTLNLLIPWISSLHNYERINFYCLSQINGSLYHLVLNKSTCKIFCNFTTFLTCWNRFMLGYKVSHFSLKTIFPGLQFLKKTKCSTKCMDHWRSKSHPVILKGNAETTKTIYFTSK